MKQFINIEDKVAIPSQKIKDGQVKKHNIGRPKTPNKKYIYLRIDKGLNLKVDNFCKENNFAKSNLFVQAVIEFMNKYKVNSQ